jgi:hypothetical protein
MAEPASDGLFGAITNFFNGPKKKPANPETNIAKFVEHVNSVGIAFNHLFLVSIGPVKGRVRKSPNFNEKINMFCHATSIPALNVMTAPYRENAAHFEVPYGYSIEPLTMNFYGDANMFIKDHFDDWYRSIVNPQAPVDKTASAGNLRLNFLEFICADIDIHVISKDASKRYSVRLINAYPKSIGDIQLSHSHPDVVSFPVQFVYERIEKINPDEALPSLTRPPETRAFPLSVWDQAVGASDELMQAATKEIDELQGRVNVLLGKPAPVTNEITSTLRDRFNKLFG